MKSVLLADSDNIVQLNNAYKYLRQEGYNVHLCSDGKQVIDAVEHNIYDIIVMPVIMPYSDVYEIIDKIKSHTEKTIYIVCITKLSNESPGRPATSWQDERISNYIVSPYSGWQIVLAVEQLMHRQVTGIRS